MPTIIERVAVNATGAQDKYFPSEETLKNSYFLHSWWSPKHGNELIAGGSLYSRKFPYLQANLLDPGGSRPGVVTSVIDNYPFWNTPATDSPVPGLILTPVGSVPTSGDWTIFVALGRHGTSALASAWSIIGNNGNTLGLRTRSSNIISVNVDGNVSPNHIVRYDDNNSDYKLIEVIYHRDIDEMILRVNDVTRDTKTGSLGWTQASSRLCILGLYDLVLGAQGYGREERVADVIVLNQSTARNSTARTIVNNMYSDILPTLW